MIELIPFLKSVLTYRCPKCRESYLFVKPMDIKKPLAMHDSCNVCQQSFEPEPGYYYGAMFMSYIVGSFILLPTALMLVFYFDMNVEKAMLIIIGLGILLFLKLLRGSRSLWIHLNVGYHGHNNKQK